MFCVNIFGLKIFKLPLKCEISFSIKNENEDFGGNMVDECILRFALFMLSPVFLSK